MNWARGFIRSWLACSVLWIAGVAWVGYIDVIAPRNKAASEHACFEKRIASPTKGNPFDCFEGNTTPAPPAGFVADRPKSAVVFDDLVPLSAHWGYLLAAFLPIILVLLFGWAVAWIIRGFRKTPAA
jgi:hypothetical protein